MNEVIIVRGIQGSGKSTWAKNWAQESPETRVRFNNDDIRNMLGTYWVPNRESVVTALKEAFLKSAIAKGYDIVMDNMNLSDKEVTWIRDTVNKLSYGTKYQYKVTLKDFFIPVEECIERDKLRPNPIGEKVIKMTFNRYKDMMCHVENRKILDSVRKTLSSDKGHCIVVDLDGTVALNVVGRPYYGEGASDLMSEDLPITPLINIIEGYRGHVCFVTGRHKGEEEQVTRKWIEDNIVKGKTISWELFCRNKSDYRKSYLYKEDIFRNHIEPKYITDFVLEDNRKCVEMYRKLGLIVLQPNEGKF